MYLWETRSALTAPCLSAAMVERFDQIRVTVTLIAMMVSIGWRVTFADLKSPVRL
jgi:hypothetical protein